MTSLTPVLRTPWPRARPVRRPQRIQGVLLAVILAVAAAGITAVGTGAAGPGTTAVQGVTPAGAAPSAASAVAVPHLEPAVAVPHLEPPPAIVADAVVPVVQLYSSPGVPWSGTKPFTNPTPQGVPLVFLVHEQQGQWLHVQVSARPNGLMAWVPLSDVRLRTDPYRIVVSLSGHTVTLFRGNTRMLSTPAAVGKPASPTPSGSFFVDAVRPLAYDGGPYGAGAMGVAAFSNVYETFGGGPGQIAIHGTNEPWEIGQSVSHGCVRISNDQWRTITSVVPAGTPVRIDP